MDDNHMDAYEKMETLICEKLMCVGVCITMVIVLVLCVVHGEFFILFTLSLALILWGGYRIIRKRDCEKLEDYTEEIV